MATFAIFRKVLNLELHWSQNVHLQHARYLFVHLGTSYIRKFQIFGVDVD